MQGCTSFSVIGREAGFWENRRMADFDEDLLRALQVDGRAQFSTLAAELGVHRSLVAQRVRELLDSGELRVLAALHPRVLGFSVQAHLTLRVAGPTRPVFERLRGLDGVVYLSEVTGPAPVVAEVWASSQGDLARTVRAMRAIPGVVEVQLALYDHVLKTLLLGEEPEDSELVFDDFDVAIMTNLQRDGRLTFGELARRTGRSASACRSRTLRLLESRVMQIGGVRRRSSVTRGVLFGVGISPEGGEEEQREVEEAVLGLTGLEFLARTIGRFSLLATVAARSVAEYTEVVRGLRELAGVHAAETWIHASVWTERYEWSLDRLVGRRGG
jgi:DNA-binding Lrp family transcriptional regulator